MSGGNREEVERLAFVYDAVRRLQVEYRRNSLKPPAGIPELLEEVGFRVSRGQGGSPLDRPEGARQAGITASPMAVKYETAAELLEVSMSTIKRMVKAGDLPTVSLGGTRRIRVSDLESLVAGQVAS